MADLNDQQHSREDLLRNTRQQHDRLTAQLAQLSDEQMTQPGVTEGWSVKDHLVYLTWWARRVMDMLGGAPDPIPALGLPDPNDDTINARVQELSRERPLAEVRTDFDTTYQDVLRFIAEVPEETLMARYGWISGNTDDHYAEHAAMLEAWRAQRQA